MEKVNPKSVIRISRCCTAVRNPNDRFGLKAESNMDIFEKDLSGAMVSPDEPGYDQLISTIFDTIERMAFAGRSARLPASHHGQGDRPQHHTIASVLCGLRQEHPHRQRMLDSARMHILM